MHYCFPKTKRITPFGFSLVEVAIAIGLISFSLIAIIGLFSIGLNNSRESADDTNLALMIRQANAWSRSESFASLSTTTNVLFYDAMGGLIRNPDGTPASTAAIAGANAIYSCTIKPVASGVSSNLVYLQLLFEWPQPAQSPLRQQRVVITSRSNED